MKALFWRWIWGVGIFAAIAPWLVWSGRAVELVETRYLPSPDVAEFLAVQRFAALCRLGGGKGGDRPVARVLVYGQSITQQEWATRLLEGLRERFPAVEWITENRAIGAFDADALIQTAEADVYPFRPDLILFHAYGPYGVGSTWERLLREFRSRTSADIVLVGNHPRVDDDLTEVTEPGAMAVGGHAWIHYEYSPRVAGELGVCWVDNRSGFKRYLLAMGESTSSILMDLIHLNAKGSAIQHALVSPYVFAPVFSPAVDPYENERVRTVRVGPGGVEWAEGRLRLEFVGNRVDVVRSAGREGKCRVWVDGRAPTDGPRGMGHGRSSSWRGELGGRPALLRVGWVNKPVVEEWTLTFTAEASFEPRSFQFEVVGSRTGPDGRGSSTQTFVSDSGRVRIELDSWNRYVMPRELQQGHVIRWSSEERGVDEYGDGVEGEGRVATVVNDLPDAAHVLELEAIEGQPVPDLAAIRVYHPSGGLPGSGVGEGGGNRMRWLWGGDEFWVAGPTGNRGGRWVRWGQLGELGGDGVGPKVERHGFRLANRKGLEAMEFWGWLER